ncbi:MAG: hypothetical protein ACKON9_19620 [Planctomycetaceae bacterium]
MLACLGLVVARRAMKRKAAASVG